MCVTQSWWFKLSWWRHQMETFSALLAICAGNSPVPGEFPSQRPVTRSFDVFFDLRQIKRLSKQSWGWWFETPSHPLCRHSNDMLRFTPYSSNPLYLMFPWTYWWTSKGRRFKVLCDITHREADKVIEQRRKQLVSVKHCTAYYLSQI